MIATLESKPKLPGFISLLLVIALGISIAKLVWLVITPQAELVLTSRDSNAGPVIQTKAIDVGKLIADQNIFGEVVTKKIPETAKVEPKVEVKPVPKVKLNAKLHGIVAYKFKQGFALISNDNGPQKVYAENDTLQDGVIISKVLGTKVLVDNNGVEEELLLPIKEDKKPSKSSKQDISNLPGYKKEKPQAANNNPSPSGESEELPDLNQFRQEILTNPSKLTDIVRASPAMVNGKFSGFRVRSGKNRKLFRQLNFRANDIITEVNGIVLDDQSKGLQVLSQLESATDLSIKVKRGTEEVFINHSF